MKKKILIIAGGKKRKLHAFKEPAKKLGLDVKLASLSDINYTSESPFILKVGATDIAKFDLIYIRIVGTRLEDATLLCNYAKERGIKLVDSLYNNAHLMPSSLGKSIETMKLIKADIPVPKTFFGNLTMIIKKAKSEFGFPFVIKSTTGKKAREVWSPQNDDDLQVLTKKLRLFEKKAKMRFFSQEFIADGQRGRVFVVGDKAMAAITRPSRWRKRFTHEEGERKALVPVPLENSRLAIEACRAVGLQIAGVDIMHDPKTGKAYIIEVNAAPSWELIKKDTGINVEEEILKYLSQI